MKFRIYRIVLCIVIFAVAFFIPLPGIQTMMFGLSCVLCGYNVILKAVKNILKGKVFDENFLMSIAVTGAFAIGEFSEAAAVMIFYQIGSVFEDYAVSKSRKSIAELMNIRPDYANLLKHGEISVVDPHKVSVGDTIVVRPGEKIPLDGVVSKGSSALDVSALTGESLPKDVSENDEVLSGSVNITGVLNITVNKEFHNSTVNKILDLVENAISKKSRSESFISRFARFYTPVVVISAALLAFVPPLFFNADLSVWGYRALNFLVVSCPCALVVSVPLSFFGGLGAASKSGVLIKGSNYLEAIAKAKTIVFDKTGTLTKGIFEIERICPEGISSDELLKTAAYAEYHSNHPLSIAIKKACAHIADSSLISDYEEIPGMGTHAVVNGHDIYAGNAKLMNFKKISVTKASDTVIHIAADKKYLGFIELSDKPKPDSLKAITALRKSGVNTIAMLTGDNLHSAEKVAEELNIHHVYANLLPKDKVYTVEEMIKTKPKNSKLVFVGDGINDAPVLSVADIGIAMGKLGSDAAIEAADIVIMTDELSKLDYTIRLSGKTLRIVRQNIAVSLTVKFAVLILSALGITGMWAAVFADVGVLVLAILNSMRCGK